MKIQLAVDRVTIERAKEIINKAVSYVDIIEVGTSLIKDYGMISIKEIKAAFPNKTILADIKTMDEGAYEFKAAYNSGADIATVMGAASIDTIKACYEVSKEFAKLMMVDLLEVSNEKILRIKEFGDTIFCVHLSADCTNKNLGDLVKDFRLRFPKINKVSVAGGVNLNNIYALKESKVDIAIIGSAITKAVSIEAAAKKFREII